MKFHKHCADFFVPDNAEHSEAFKRVTHLGIGAHQDDLELIALHGILSCFDNNVPAFGGVTCADGAGSPRSGQYAEYTNEEMQALRLQEQRTAACIGRYSFMIQLGYQSKELKDPSKTDVVEDLLSILTASRVEVVYTHNLADKHDTHVAVVVAAIQAIRSIPIKDRPKKLYGCEAWRDLDWLMDGDKVVFNTDKRSDIAQALVGVFDSQIVGGKRYDLAGIGRRQANATFYKSHEVDSAQQIYYGMDLSPLIQTDTLDLVDFVMEHIDRFSNNARAKLEVQLGRKWK